MNDWDSRYPFSNEELDLFARLHAKATKFPAPPHLKTTNKIKNTSENLNGGNIINNPINRPPLESLKGDLDSMTALIRNFDLLIESHRQLQFVESAPQNYRVDLEKDEIDLQTLRQRIEALESIESARSFLKNCAISSVASSPHFLNSLKIVLHQQASSSSPSSEDEAIIARSATLMQKCWDNALQAMHRVLERDLISLEAYLDDPVYSNLRNQVLKPLITTITDESKLANPSLSNTNLVNPVLANANIVNPALANANIVNPALVNANLANPVLANLFRNFIDSYVTFRQHFLKSVFDVRLNAQLASTSSDPKDHILHLIERARLSMLVEHQEFSSLFPETPAALNKILETVGNLILGRLMSSLSNLSHSNSHEILQFIKPLRRDLLIKNSKDPFGLFLEYIQSQIKDDNNNNSNHNSTKNNNNNNNNNINNTNDLSNGIINV